MREVKKWLCPYYERIVDELECYEMYLIAIGGIRDEALVKEEECDALCAMCDKCKKHGVIDAREQK